MQISALGRQAALFISASKGASSKRTADSAEALWIDIDAALTPIIGARGVNALFKRSVSLVGNHHPWLQVASNVAVNPHAFSVLAATLSQQSPSSAATVNGELLQAFYELLAGLIGDPLTTRLLQPALENLSNGDDALEMAQ